MSKITGSNEAVVSAGDGETSDPGKDTPMGSLK